jgi:hypothetical protein
MSITVCIGLHDKNDPPHAVLVPCGDRRSFISLKPSREVSIHLIGYDRESIAQARALAAALTSAADQLEQQMGIGPAPDADADLVPSTGGIA